MDTVPSLFIRKSYAFTDRNRVHGIAPSFIKMDVDGYENIM